MTFTSDKKCNKESRSPQRCVDKENGNAACYDCKHRAQQKYLLLHFIRLSAASPPVLLKALDSRSIRASHSPLELHSPPVSRLHLALAKLSALRLRSALDSARAACSSRSCLSPLRQARTTTESHCFGHWQPMPLAPLPHNSMPTP